MNNHCGKVVVGFWVVLIGSLLFAQQCWSEANTATPFAIKPFSDPAEFPGGPVQITRAAHETLLGMLSEDDHGASVWRITDQSDTAQQIVAKGDSVSRLLTAVRHPESAWFGLWSLAVREIAQSVLDDRLVRECLKREFLDLCLRKFACTPDCVDWSSSGRLLTYLALVKLPKSRS